MGRVLGIILLLVGYYKMAIVGAGHCDRILVADEKKGLKFYVLGITVFPRHNQVAGDSYILLLASHLNSRVIDRSRIRLRVMMS